MFDYMAFAVEHPKTFNGVVTVVASDVPRKLS